MRYRSRRSATRALQRFARRRAAATARRWAIGAAITACVGLAPKLGLHLPTAAAATLTPSTAAAPFAGGPAGCVVDDPTTSGCITAKTEHALAEIDRVFGGYRHGPVILSAGCWDPHLQNPTSDHPKGRACDFFFGPTGVFASGPSLDHGWELAKWLRANAVALQVRYVIWQGRIWQADDDRDAGGWGKPYNGGGIYDPHDATGGHYDHVHASFQS